MAIGTIVAEQATPQAHPACLAQTGQGKPPDLLENRSSENAASLGPSRIRVRVLATAAVATQPAPRARDERGARAFRRRRPTVRCPAAEFAATFAAPHPRPASTRRTECGARGRNGRGTRGSSARASARGDLHDRRPLPLHNSGGVHRPSAGWHVGLLASTGLARFHVAWTGVAGCAAAPGWRSAESSTLRAHRGQTERCRGQRRAAVVFGALFLRR